MTPHEILYALSIYILKPIIQLRVVTSELQRVVINRKNGSQLWRYLGRSNFLIIQLFFRWLKKYEVAGRIRDLQVGLRRQYYFMCLLVNANSKTILGPIITASKLNLHFIYLMLPKTQHTMPSWGCLPSQFIDIETIDAVSLSSFSFAFLLFASAQFISLPDSPVPTWVPQLSFSFSQRLQSSFRFSNSQTDF